MKRFLLSPFLTAFLCMLTFSGCGGSGKGTSGSATLAGGFDKDTSYAMGMMLASSWKEGGITLNNEEFFRGFKAVMQDSKTRLSLEEADMKIDLAFTERREKTNGELIQKENEFLAENSKKTGLTITGSGLQYEIISEGSGPKPAASNVVRVNYEGKLIDGTVFDSSYMWGEPAEISLNGVISGWTEGVQLMNTGSKYRFYIPSALGYGENGSGLIPPYAPLIFEIELLEIIR